ncbi:MAG: peptidoglycan D,D-transpeptidase FtsI family protein [Actinomycetota bacterium]
MAAFGAVFLMLNWVQIVRADHYSSKPENFRSLLAQASIKRGDIVTLEGVTLATSKRTGNDTFKYQREYPHGALYGPITGYYNLLNGTAAGIENAYDDQLLGESGVISMDDFEDTFLGSGEAGDDVRLTIVHDLQVLAQQSLGDQEGAVVAMDPNTGEIRAFYSNPSYDPNPLSSYERATVREAFQALDPRSGTSPLVNKAARRLYPPGSTFKVVTAAAALESGRYNPNSTFPDPESIDLPRTDRGLTNFTNTACTGTGSIDLFTAVEVSCDTTFALLGLRIHGEIKSTSEAFGFNEALPFDLTTEPSAFPEVPDDLEPFRAYQAIGQGDTSATPLQMAVVAAGIANGGEVPRPRLVKEVLDPSAGVVERYSPETIGTAMSSQNAAELTRMMTAVVQSGTGTAAQIPGITVAGKTGTAQTVEGAAPHAWFICFAPVERPQIAVAVLVENGGALGSEATGGAVAAPIARQIIEADKEIRGW